jgi:hypothetical protein
MYSEIDLQNAFEAGREYQEYKGNINLEEKSWEYTFEKWFDKYKKYINNLIFQIGLQLKCVMKQKEYGIYMYLVII